VKVGSFAKPARSDESVFLHLTFSAAQCVSRNDWHFGYYKDMPLAAAKIEAKVEGNTIAISADKPAFFVWANIKGVRGEFDDNSFTLLPGRPRTLRFDGRLDGKRVDIYDLSGLTKRQ
jgi:beta-mannosidase